VTEDVAGRLLRLPLYNTMTIQEQDRVIEAVQGFYGT
jgi:dTDP-4-amino-4,6-dideoxygalactose transaminase